MMGGDAVVGRGVGQVQVLVVVGGASESVKNVGVS